MIYYQQRLPYDAEVEYLESVGLQYIDTGIPVCNSVLGTEIKFQATETTHDKWVFGSFNSTLGNSYNYLIGSYGGWNVFLSNGQHKPGTATDTNVHVVKINIDGKTQFDDVLLYTGDVIKSYDGPYSTNAWIFQTHRREYGMPFNSYYLKAKVFYCKMYQDGVLVRDFIPVRFTNEQNQNEGAMYDKVSGQLFRNAGAENFIIGDDIESNEGKTAWLNLHNRQLMPLLPRYSFGVVSDLHVNSTSNGAPQDIERMFKKFENRHISKVFCCGDITTNHTAAQLSTFTDIKDQYPDIDFYSCNGNHDVGLTDAEWQTYIGHPFKHWFMWHNDAFIFMPIDVWEGSHPYQANLDWLEGLLQDLASTRVFLFIHFPLNSNSSSFQYPGLEIGQTYGFSSDSEDNAALTQMLKDHGNVIVFTGHSHYALETQDEQASGEQMVFFEEDGVSHVHVPSLSRPRDRSMEYIEDGHPELQPSQGLQVDVYDKFIKVRGIEFNLTVGDGRKGNDRLQNLYVGQNTLSLWSNPYVTDGLVAMWDGEWNVGPGKHSSTTSTWKDLSGNKLHMISNGTPVWFDNYISPTQESEMWHTAETDICDGMLQSGVLTVEVVAQCVVGYTLPKFLMFGPFAFGVRASCGDPTRVGFNCFAGNASISNYGSQNLLAYHAMTSDGETVTGLYKSSSGTLTRSVSIIPPITDIWKKQFFIGYRGGYYPDGPMIHGEHIYSIRVYNKTLTQEEISANYEIDKWRFNL